MKESSPLKPLEPIRCGSCRALLFKAPEMGYTEVQIKCRRCGTINHLKAEQSLLRESPIERQQREKNEIL